MELFSCARFSAPWGSSQYNIKAHVESRLRALFRVYSLSIASLFMNEVLVFFFSPLGSEDLSLSLSLSPSLWKGAVPMIIQLGYKNVISSTVLFLILFFIREKINKNLYGNDCLDRLCEAPNNSKEKGSCEKGVKYTKRGIGRAERPSWCEFDSLKGRQ